MNYSNLVRLSLNKGKSIIDIPMRTFKKASPLLSPNDSLQNTVQLAFQDLSTGAV